MLASDRISKTSINSLNIFIFITVYLTCISSVLVAFFLGFLFDKILFIIIRFSLLFEGIDALVDIIRIVLSVDVLVENTMAV